MQYSQKSQSITNIHFNKRQLFRKQIRREFIQQYTKNKRKQLFGQGGVYSIQKMQQMQPKLIEHQQKYDSFLVSLTPQAFAMEPNNHIQLFNEILNSDAAQNYKKFWATMLIIVHDYVMSKLQISSQIVDSMIQNLSLLQQKSQDRFYLFTQNTKRMLSFNAVFFEPYTGKQFLTQQSTTIFNFKKQPNMQPNAQIISQIQYQKINIMLVLQFFVFITYQLSPSIFIDSLQEKILIPQKLSNGYDEMYFAKEYTNYQHETNNLGQFHHQNNPQINTQKLHHFIRIYNNIYDFAKNLNEMAIQFRHQQASIQKISKILHKFDSQMFIANNYQTSKLLQSIKFLQYSQQSFFLKINTQPRITHPSLIIFQNITALTESEYQLDCMIHSKQLLNSLQQIQEQYGFTKEELLQVLEIYCNLVEGEISFVSKQKYQLQHCVQNKSIDVEIDDQTGNSISLHPGVYLCLLDAMVEQIDSLEYANKIVFVLISILEKYQVEQKSDNEGGKNNQVSLQNDTKNNEQQSKKLILHSWVCEHFAAIMCSLDQKVKFNQFEVQHYSKLFILLCNKMLHYVLYLSQLVQMLQLIIENENKRLFYIQEKRKATLQKSQPIENLKKQSKMIKQNMKHIIQQSGILLKIFAYEIKKFGVKENSINMANQLRSDLALLADLDGRFELFSQSIIDKIIYLWNKNELEYCHYEFAAFIKIAVKYWPQHILLSSNHCKDDYFLSILLEIGDHQNEDEFFLQILEYAHSYYTQIFQQNCSKNSKDVVRQFFIRNKDNWDNILQIIQGKLYASKTQKGENVIENNQKVQFWYDSYSQLIKKILENMQLQI